MCMFDIVGFDLFTIMFTLITVVIVGMFLYAIINGLLNVTAEEQSKKVTLIGKDSSISVNHSTEHSHSNTTYTFIFEDTHKERLSLNVSKKVYHQYVIGDKGTVRYKRNWFRSFDRQG